MKAVIVTVDCPNETITVEWLVGGKNPLGEGEAIQRQREVAAGIRADLGEEPDPDSPIQTHVLADEEAHEAYRQWLLDFEHREEIVITRQTVARTIGGGVDTEGQ